MLERDFPKSSSSDELVGLKEGQCEALGKIVGIVALGMSSYWELAFR